MDKVWMWFESDGPIGNTFSSFCPDSDYQEINVNMKDLIVFYKSQAKEIEGLRGKVKLYEQFIKNGVETNNIRIPDLIDPARKTIDELLDTTLLGTTQPDTKQKD